MKIHLAKVLMEYGISKRGFSKMLEEDTANVFRYFREGYNPKLSTIKKWADALEMPVGKLVSKLLDEL